MDDDILPHHFQTGAQLAVGVRGASMYIPSGPKSAKNGSWVRYCEDNLPFNLSKLRISSEVTVLEDPSNSLATGFEIPQSPRHDLSFSQNRETDSEEHWKKAIIKDLKWERLSPVIPSNLQVFKKVEFGEDHMYEVRHGSPVSQYDYVPDTLIADLTHSDSLQVIRKGNRRKSEKLLAFDPIINELFVTGNIQTTSDLRNNNDEHQIIACSSGETNSILKLVTLREDKLHVEDDAVWLRNLFATNGDNKLGQGVEINLNSTIKSIKIPIVSALLGRGSDTVGVLTENALHFIRIENFDLQTSEISYSLHDPLRFITFGEFPLADFAFNPWELQQFAVVDTRGNWGIARLPKTNKGGKIRFLSNMRGSIFDPEELSNWKRIEWSSSYSRLLLLDPSKVVELDFEKNWQLEVVQAKTWSCLRDYKRADEDFGALLTSKEIIIVGTRCNEQITRLVSWKHSLDSSDQTLRLSVQKIPIESGMLILSSIFSKGHNNVYVHAFCYDKERNLIQSMKGPIVLRMPNVERGIYSMHLLPCFDDNNWINEEVQMQEIRLNLFVKENRTDKLLHCYLSEVENSNLKKQGLNVSRIHTEGTLAKVTLPDPKKYEKIKSFARFLKNESLPVNNKGNEAVQDGEIFQQFGYKLSEHINAVIESWEANEKKNVKNMQPLLKDLTDVPTNFESIEEFQSLLEQLSEYYKDVGVSFTELVTVSKLLLQEGTQNLDVFRNKLLQCWEIVTDQSLQLTREVFERIIWSTLRFYKPENYRTIANNLTESIGEPYSEIIGLWDEDQLSILEENAPAGKSMQESSQPQFFSNSQSQIPVIKSSQSRLAKKSRHSRISQVPLSQDLSFTQTNRDLSSLRLSSNEPSLLPGMVAPAFTLMSPSAPTFSQSHNSQKARRKKKRVGGFG